jgi:hypothetical protein
VPAADEGSDPPTGSRSPPLPRFTPLLAGALLLASVSVAHAAPDASAVSDPGLGLTAADDGGSFERPLHSRSPGRGDAVRPTPRRPYRGLRAVAYPLAWLGFFARSEDFSHTRAAALNDVESGAMLQVGRGVGITAAYRVLGSSVGFDSMLLGAGGKAGIRAPFLSVELDF